MEKPEDGPGRGGAQETQRQGQKKTGRRREGESGVELTETEHSGGGVLLLVRWTRRRRSSAIWPPTLHTRSVYSPQNLRGDCSSWSSDLALYPWLGDLSQVSVPLWAFVSSPGNHLRGS